MSSKVDVVIAGGGPAGLLTALKMSAEFPDKSILLLERESIPGGRLRSAIETAGLWNHGLDRMHADLYEVWDQLLKLDPEGDDLATFASQKLEEVGILSSQKINSFGREELFAEKGVRALGGGAAWRDWRKVMVPTLEALQSGSRKHQAFHSVWPGTRKNASAVVLEHFAHILGMPDVWSAHTQLLLNRHEEFSKGEYVGPWSQAIDLVVERLNSAANVSVECDAHIIKASRDGDWTISTRKGEFACDSLVVAQNPWDALRWLPKNLWPNELLQFAVKAKPVSVVTLTEIVDGDMEALPDVTIVPAESVQVIKSAQSELVYQATIDFEVSLQAPDVVKAVRRLKRARKKLHQCGEWDASGEHIALLPVGWAQPTGFLDRRWMEKLAKATYQSRELAFVGDAYGPNYHGDKNIVESMRVAVQIVLGTGGTSEAKSESGEDSICDEVSESQTAPEVEGSLET